ncbi:hypothetical protein [Rubellimicrobium aerolatum]|uniref:Uncharacterized protein n=1 Tax=Rubellimicrobium aerolatum TaxID=490979 RepID=A0ABW0SE07_9RHOB|nr:hypothetical protein [Rubellimicrobium aerolatum]MBP1806851.1 ABC-type spermidine/putrescine transport system permease subunit II [Rubellimicrobium aerolatum]
MVLGLLAAIALVRGTFRERRLVLTPMILPVVILAVALYIVFLRLGPSGTFVGFVVAHRMIALPFSIIAISGAENVAFPLRVRRMGREDVERNVRPSST